MVICSFLGNETIYDTKVRGRLMEAVERVVEENDAVDFWLYIRGSSILKNTHFIVACCEAVTEVKKRWPNKIILLTLIGRSDRSRDMEIPICLVDRVITAPDFFPRQDVQDFSSVPKKIQRWIMKQSEYIICYVYKSFYEIENQLLTSARASGATLYDVTDPDTAAAIVDSYRLLKERERFILKCRDEGQSLKEIGEQLGITGNGVREAERYACYKLRVMALERKAKLEEQPETDVCGIFGLGKETEESIEVFRQALEYLIKKCHVTRFLILWEYCSGPYMRVLKEMSYKDRTIRLVAVTHFSRPEDMSEERKREIRFSLCPPCHDTENIDTRADRRRSQVLRASKALIDRADYCICSLAGNPLEENLRKYIEKRRKPVILDLSEKDTL